MDVVLFFTQADAVAWICFGIGVIVLGGGVAVGLWTAFRQAPRKASEARAKLQEASARLEEASARVAQSAARARDPMLEGLGVGDAGQAAAAAQESTEAAKTALEQVQGIVGSLPENLRFAGLLVLVGTVLMGVATVQFGGVSLF